jgi:hypothetical protein
MRLAAVAAAVLAAGVLASAARGDGLPVQNVEVGQTGVEDAAKDVRYVAVGAGGDTVVHRIRTNGGQLLGSRMLRGRYTIPAVAYDGSAAGLAADGATLVLISPRRAFPRRTTTFAVLETNGLQLLDRLRLRGDFSFDAVSPNGRWLYLIEYTSPKDPVQYQVRTFDLLNRRLHPDAVVDPRQPDEAMNGHPLTRAASPDGRWAYTLYEGADHPFVHALDTVNRDARCIDLDWLHGRNDVAKMRFAVSGDGGDLRVRVRGRDVAHIDTRRFEASIPRPGSSRWRWLLVPAAALVVAGPFAYRAGSRRASSTSFGGATSA